MEGDTEADIAGPLRILLVSPDLLAVSRLAAMGRQCGAAVETLRNLDDPPRDPACDVVLLDLQALAEDPAVLVTRLRVLLPTITADEGPRLVAFGPHVAKQRLEDARAAGAQEVLTRGELLGAFPALVRRWRGADGPPPPIRVSDRPASDPAASDPAAADRPSPERPSNGG
jgi:hypothetical protein